jgi:catechol 2,3-dioxygenase-like lactoylglutathione lyase family enzyme
MNKEDIEKVKAGHPVQTRDGRKARVICWDLKNDRYSVVAIVCDNDEESVETYTESLKFRYDHENDPSWDLILSPRKVRIDDLSGLKVGDKVYCLMYGEGVVITIFEPDNIYPVYVRFNDNANISYSKDGRNFVGANQTLFLSKPEIIINEIEI